MKLSEILFPNEISSALRDFFENNNKESLRKVFSRLPKSPDGLRVYRGMKVTDKAYRALSDDVAFSREETDRNGTEYKLFKGRGMVPGPGDIQSWTTNPGVAIQFAVDPERSGEEGGEIIVVFVAETGKGGNDFVGEPGKLAQGTSREHEQEVVSNGPVEFIGFAVSVPADDGFFGRNPTLVNVSVLKQMLSQS